MDAQGTITHDTACAAAACGTDPHATRNPRGRRHGAAALVRSVSPVRVVGYSLYNFWLLATFYNTFLFLSASDFRGALYMNQMLSLGVLALTLALLPIALKRADKWVLSQRFALGAGLALAAFTALLAFADPAAPLGVGLIVASGIGTGVSSGVLFLGWGRLYSDVGPRLAMVETSFAWIAAGSAAAAASFAPPPPACAFTVAGAFASALLLRKAALNRPVRPRPARPHKLQRRTRRMFARALVACASVGVVAGFSDVLTGFRFMAVPAHYEVLLAASCAAAVALVMLAALWSRHDFVTYAYRLVAMLLIAGCVLTPLAEHLLTLSNVVIFGAYPGFVVLLCVVCIDTSNYFDQPATRTFGLAFFALYAGELLGNALGHLTTDVLVATPLNMSIVTCTITIAVVFANLFLFTEKDLTETSLGEMTDENVPDLDSPRTGATAMGAGDLEQRVTCITSLFVRRYGLTPREADVLPLIVKGRTIARIQEELHISQGTVSTHTRHIYQKTGVRNRQALLDLIDQISDTELEEALLGEADG